MALLYPFRLFFFLLSPLRLPLEIFVDVVLALLIGLRVNGVRGAGIFAARMLRRRPEVFEDGLQSTTTLTSEEGFPMPEIAWFDQADSRAQVRRLAEMVVRDDDVIVVSYPKCGHHFLNEILHMLLSGELKLDPWPKYVRFLELFPRPQEYFDKMRSPRVILTHLPVNMLPRSVLEGRCKIVRASRNPKDVMVSYYHHMLAIKHHFYSDSFENFATLFLSSPSRIQYGSYLTYEREYLEAGLGHSTIERPIVRHVTGVDCLVNAAADRVIHVTFEALKKETTKTVEALAEFLGRPYSERFYRGIAEATAFTRVKAAKESRLLMNAGRSLFRTGVVGDWRRFLTVAINDAVDAAIEKEWGGTPLEAFFDYGGGDGIKSGDADGGDDGGADVGGGVVKGGDDVNESGVDAGVVDAGVVSDEEKKNG